MLKILPEKMTELIRDQNPAEIFSEDQPCDKSVLRQSMSVGGEDTCSMSSITFPIQSNEQTKRSIWA